MAPYGGVRHADEYCKEARVQARECDLHITWILPVEGLGDDVSDSRYEGRKGQGELRQQDDCEDDPSSDFNLQHYAVPRTVELGRTSDRGAHDWLAYYAIDSKGLDAAKPRGDDETQGEERESGLRF